MGDKLNFMFERIDSRSDALTQVLEAVHLGSVLSARIELDAPWALHYGKETGHRAGFHVVARGRCCAYLDSAEERVTLGEGDVVVLPHGSGHTLGDHPATPAVEFADLVSELPPGERVELPSGGSGDPTVLLCGSYSFGAEGGNPLLRGLPEMLHVPAESSGDALGAAVRLLIGESAGTESGSALIVEQLVELVFVYALRAWIGQNDASGSYSWFGALHNEIVGPAVQAIHDDPAYAWTVEALAQRSGMSRATFARRFHKAVGEPPLTYVTRWRMTVAADLLEQGWHIADVAHKVGYENEFAFAKAFKRVRGVAPGRLRRRRAG
jgi:AraC-like DNA-binding protein